MGLLDTMTAEEAIKHGVTVYPHVTEPKAQPLDVSRFNVPAWARWIAADKSGHIYPYSAEPVCGKYSWICHEGEIYINASNKLGTIDLTDIDWRLTLTPVPSQPSDWMQAHIAAEVAAIDAQPWCERCNLPDDICRGHDEPAPTTLAWQIAQLDGDGITTLARQLARADSTKASLIAEALWSEAMDVEHAQLQADDAAMEGSNRRAVWGDRERHARIWDAIEAQLRVAQ